ncbi:Aste57867_783 [Aphanomyces stellatus]|uniref:Aste57867_783 protein n=1 Tax=Aphanomyces stellatus TaxID=120398 RepID=A0A485K4N7_9STRA|nr:hypothetical protein As57867_000782 [Aphanomyces stellatus]VFT78007.1 Aste57867_783 [Aphanomyces stellatus]
MAVQTAGPPPPVLGLTLGFFKHFMELHGGRDAFQDITTATMCSSFVKPFTIDHCLSLVEHVFHHHPNGAQYVKPATWFVSHAWSYKFVDVVDALTDFFSDQGLESDNVAVWFCMFNNNQHLINDVVIPFEFWVDSFQSALKAIGNVVMVLSPWNNPATLTRTWCVFEIYVASVINARFEVAMGKAQKQAFLQDVVGNTFMKMVSAMRSEYSSTAVPSDRDKIVDVMQAANVTFADLDRMMFDQLETWMMRTLQTLVDGSRDLAQKARWLYVMSCLAYGKKDFVNAKRYVDDALQIYRHELHDQVEGTWKALGRAGAIGFVTKQPRETWEPMMQEALTGSIGALGRHHPSTLETMYGLGYMQIMAGAFDDGLPLVQTCYEHCQYEGLKLVAKATLGQCWLLQHKLHEAEECLVECWEWSSRLDGRDHLTTQMNASYLMMAYFKQGKFKDATRMNQEGYASRSRTFGPDHQETWTALSNMGYLQLLMGKIDGAKQIFEACMAAATRLGQTATRQLNCQLKFGQLYVCVGHHDLARLYLQHAYDGLKDIYSAPHTFTRTALYWSCFLLYHAHVSMAEMDQIQEKLQDADCFHDTWTLFPCHGCFQPLQGTYYACPQCPKFAYRFCRSCVAQSKPASVCNHGTSLEGMKPPARYIQEKRLALLAQDDDLTEFNTHCQVYCAYCSAYQVPVDEQIIQGIRCVDVLEFAPANLVSTISIPYFGCDWDRNELW